jgi:hypothetical protein
MVQRPMEKEQVEKNTLFAVIETGCFPLQANIANPLPATARREERQREREPISTVLDIGIQRRQNSVVFFTICS